MKIMLSLGGDARQKYMLERLKSAGFECEDAQAHDLRSFLIMIL